jgi:DNA-directed RNA polymerase subunit beta'
MHKSNFDGLMVTLASPQEILKWSYGTVESPETINYRTGKPKLKWLFCEAIFWPVKPHECSCGKYKGVRYKGIVCERCGVEVTNSRVRRERMGHIELACPVVHIWYYKATPSRIGLLLGLSTAEIEKILYYVKYIVTADVSAEKMQELVTNLEQVFSGKIKELEEIVAEETKAAEENNGISSLSGMSLKEIKKAYDDNKITLEKEYNRIRSILAWLKQGATILESDYRNFFYKHDNVFKFKSGSDAIMDLLSVIDVQSMIQDVIARFKEIKGEERKKTFKLLRLLINLYVSDVRPEWMIMKYLPVVPPDLRPVVQLDGGRFASSDVNQFYRRVVQRNLRLKKMIQVGMPDVVKKNEIRLLQESINNLMVGEKGSSKWANGGKVFRSLTDMLSGKEGIFRKNLLGKRVDYSGRSVITVGPDLKLDECGLPLYIAVRIFSPFIISKLIERNIAYTPKQAEKLIKEQDPVALEILHEVIKDKYVLLNRAPTLHRLSIQAFKVRLMPGKTIRIHPLVTPAFNADFDGDQMAVHLPLWEDAQNESRAIVSSAHNILKPASGEPVITHTQDMVLWVYSLTYQPNHDAQPVGRFADIADIIHHVELGDIAVNDLVVLRYEDRHITTTAGRVIFNSILPEQLQFTEMTDTKITNKILKKILDKTYDLCGPEVMVRVADAIKDMWFKYATQSAVSNNIFDVLIPQEKEEIIKKWDEAAKIIQDQWYYGFLSDEEKSRLLVQHWMNIVEQIEGRVKAIYKEQSQDTANDFYMLTESGARGKVSNLAHIGGMKGMVVSPSGKVIELPIKSSYMEWFSPLEYFISAHGARKGRADTALKTADAWYLTRRLCDSSQEVIVKEHDCGTHEFIIVDKYESEARGETFVDLLYGRFLAKDVLDEHGKVLYTKDTFIDKDVLSAFTNAGVDSVAVKSPLTCHTQSGVCQKCFGMDLSSRQVIKLGVPIGILASQSIGEPGTQLTMNTRHLVWVQAEWDITWGMERLNELLEVRNPARKAVIAPFEGTVRIHENGKLFDIEVVGEADKRYYPVKEWYKATVKPGTTLKKGGSYASKGVSKLKVKEDGQVIAIKDDILILGVVNSLTQKSAPNTSIKVKDGDTVAKGQILTSGTLDIKEYQKTMWDLAAQLYVVKEMKKVYTSQGQDVNDKYMEIIVKQMFCKVMIEDAWDTSFVPGSLVKYEEFLAVNNEMLAQHKTIAKGARLVLGLTQIAKEWEGWLSSASFQETVRVMVDNSLQWSIDRLDDLKSNVILGRLLPIGTNFDQEKDLMAGIEM